MTTHRTILKQSLASAAILGGVLLIVPGAANAAPQPHTVGFVVTWFGYGIHRGDDDCPEGMANKTDVAAVLQRFPKEKRDELQLPTHRMDLQKILVGRGPHGEDVCLNPESVAEPRLRTVQGKVAYGLPLDGGKAKGAQCPREKFIGLDGTPGVDNQIYRVIGCMFGFRQDGEGGYLEKFFNQMLLDGESSILIEVSGVTDMRNDKVEVGVYQGTAPLSKDATGKAVLSDGSFPIDENPHWHNLTHGTIVNGVLSTEPIDMHLHRANNDMKEWFFRDARLRLELKDDGAHGVFAAYQDWEPIYRHWAKGSYAEISVGHTCPAFYQALKENADGYRDDSGQCTAISLAYKVDAIPAFIIHPGKKIAASGVSAP
jgi:hypothetical protein